MGVISWIKEVWRRPPERRSDTSGNTQTSSRYPIYDGHFWRSITWECEHCGTEIYWLDEDSYLTCHTCGHEYTLHEDDFPEPLRAKCWRCDKISDEVGGFRHENVVFRCPHCSFQWKSSRY